MRKTSTSLSWTYLGWFSGSGSMGHVLSRQLFRCSLNGRIVLVCIYNCPNICMHDWNTCIGYSTIETKEAARIGDNGFLFPHEYWGEGRVGYKIREDSFVSIIMYLTCTIIVLLKK